MRLFAAVFSSNRSASRGFLGLVPKSTKFFVDLAWPECCFYPHEPLRFRYREVAMEEAIDHSQATSSPEEMAIHFLLRHAECRSALTGQTGEERPHAAPAPTRSDEPAAHQIAINSQRSEGSLPSNHAASAGVTKGDSCTARFLRAYAAARHIRVDIDTPRRVRTTTMASPDAESDLTQGCRESVKE